VQYIEDESEEEATGWMSKWHIVGPQKWGYVFRWTKQQTSGYDIFATRTLVFILEYDDLILDDRSKYGLTLWGWIPTEKNNV